jgi:hypothetical protein
MTSELFVLSRVIGVSFYQRNVGFFLVIFLLLFGIAGEQAWPMHKAIMYEIAGSPAVWLLAAFVWLLYAIKCLQFGLKTLSMPENEFLYTVSLLPIRRQLYSLFLVQCYLYLPVWGYALTTTVIALRTQAYELALATVLFNGVVCLAMAYAGYRKLNYPDQDRNLSWLSQVFRVRFPKPFAAFYWSYLLQEEKMLLLSTKAFSLLILSGVFPLYASVDYDARMLWIAYLLSAFTHVIVAQQLRSFEERWLLVTRNLPLSITARFGLYLLVYFVVILSEMLTLALKFSSTFDWNDWAAYASLAMGICLGSHCFLFIPHQDPEKFIPRVFFAFIVLFLLVMYRISPLLQALALLALSYSLLHRYYYRYEP